MTGPVRITDVSPRDGLQNESGSVPTSEKARLVELVSRTGVEEVEITSFVSPKWIPQLGDAPELCDLLAQRKPPDVVWSALVPNERGLDALLAANERAGARLVDKIALFTAASETFSKRNANATIAESLARFRSVVERARDAGLAIRGYVSCAIACPFEGPIAPAAVRGVADELVDLGIDDLDLGDTIGAATPETLATLLDVFLPAAAELGPAGLTLHLHDTHGRAAECLRVALDAGVRSLDGAVGGLGGCPYASTVPGERAPGNVATETVVRVVRDAGLPTRIDDAALQRAADAARSIVAAARALPEASE